MDLSRQYKPYAIVFGLFLAHLAILALPSVNLEFTFVDAAIYFGSKDVSLLDQYFRFQANTLGVPYLGHLATFILPSFDVLLVLRLLSSLGIILLGIGIINFSKFLNRPDTINLLLLILLNPLVWIFSGRATADFLPAALGIFAISLLVSDVRTLPKILFASILLGIAAILKYHSILLLIILASFLFNHKTKKFKWNVFLLASSISILMMLTYIFFIRIYFGFWLTPPAFQSRHQVDASSFINNFFLYIGYLVMLCAPISFLLNNLNILASKKFALAAVLSLVFFVIGFYGFHNHGELNVGPLDIFINRNILNGLLVTLSICFFSIFFIAPIDVTRPLIQTTWFSIFLIILALSLTRPAQRYLLFVIPFYVLILPKYLILNKYLIRSSIGLFLLINIFIGYNQWCTGLSAEIIVKKIQEENLLTLSSPGVIEPHVGNQFSHYEIKDAQYTVTSGLDPNAKIFVQSGFLFLNKSLSLTELPRTPDK